MINGNLPCQRASPRFKTNFPAKLESDFFCISAQITNLSASGLQLECEHESLRIIMPNITRSNNHLPIRLHISFQVTTQTRSQADISLVCSLIYVRRIAPLKALLGCQFNEFKEDSEGALLNYLEHFGVPL